MSRWLWNVPRRIRVGSFRVAGPFDGRRWRSSSKTLGTLVLGSMPSISPKRRALRPYGLALEQKPLVVKITTERQFVSLTFGDPKPAANDRVPRPTYVRVNDSPEVLRLGGRNACDTPAVRILPTAGTLPRC